MDDFNAVRSAVAGNAAFTAVRPRSAAAETPRPATAGPLIVRADNNTGLRPTSSLSNELGVDENMSAASSGAGTPYIPFIVEPSSGIVAPGKSAVVTVKFSPLDVNDYEGRLICRSV